MLYSLKPNLIEEICLKIRKLSLNTIREINSDFKVIVGHPNGHILKILEIWRLYVGKIKQESHVGIVETLILGRLARTQN